MSETVLHSPLEAIHIALGARLIPFGGWSMPVQYTSILTEHAAVREKAGVFDISHMGQVFVTGENSIAYLNRLLTNNLETLSPGQGQYTLMLNGNGGIIDDLIAYRISETETLLVINASMIPEDVAWMEKHLMPGVAVRNESDAWAGLAIQGPDATQIFHKLFPADTLPPRNGIAYLGTGEIVCRTGYTGEDGYEFFCPAGQGGAFFEKFIAAGATPCGLGARDTLRLEMGYPLNGNDLSPQRSPIEAGLGFFVDLGKPDFIGRDVLLSQKENGPSHKLAGIRLTEKGPPPRPHYPVLDPAGEVLGELSSGVLSPTLNLGIGMAYLPAEHAKIGTPLLIDIRSRHFKAVTVKKPFLKKSK
ncbi:MAG: glycine cleavage system aminomethyltransferase GcvT [Armatimonadetes bacterium]|nr:glycine cleavage system aminomethyltransferase GcvT [Akkermansiaceae bacterium]